MAKELSRDEFYFIDFVPAGSTYDMHRMNSVCPGYLENFGKHVLADRDFPDRVHFARELKKDHGFLIGWGKRRSLMKMITLTDMNAYVVQGMGFDTEQDATAFILKWS